VTTVKRQHVFAHGAVAHGVGAAGTGGAHAADAGVGARVDRKEQTGVANLVVQLHARHAGLHRDGQVFGMDADDLVHAAEVQADAALHCQQMAFQRRARAVRNHRHGVLVGQLQHRGHVAGALAEHHPFGRRRVQRRLIATVLNAHRHRGGTAVAEASLQRIEHGRWNGARREQMRGNRCVHESCLQPNR